MASYKVPQDVEADDKLIGPFSFRQFIYLIIVALAGALAWGLAQVFVGLAIIPIPVILLFGALALPLKKDQPMEIYLAAIVSFYLKPRRRLWDPEGIESVIQITAPKAVEEKRTKDLSEGEAHERLSYLANLVDTQGWSIRGTTQNIAMNNDIVLEAQGAEDILDTNTAVAAQFNTMIQASTQRMHDEARERMFAPTPEPQPQMPMQMQQPVQPIQQPATPQIPQQMPVQSVYQEPQQPSYPEEPLVQPVFNPYPTFNQSVMQPLSAGDQMAVPIPEPQQPEVPIVEPQAVEEPVIPQTPEPSTSETEPSADIIELANSSDLSIQTIARQANRLKKKAEGGSDEVVISLR